MFQSSAFQSNAFQSPGGIAAIVGGHFIPTRHKNKRTLSNVNVIYKQAQTLPRKETKELRDAISDFVEPSIARQPIVPDISQINYEALQSNRTAYERFSQALLAIQERLEMAEKANVSLVDKQQQEDDELLLIATIASIIH